RLRRRLPTAADGIDAPVGAGDTAKVGAGGGHGGSALHRALRSIDTDAANGIDASVGAGGRAQPVAPRSHAIGKLPRADLAHSRAGGEADQRRKRKDPEQFPKHEFLLAGDRHRCRSATKSVETAARLPPSAGPAVSLRSDSDYLRTTWQSRMNPVS